MFFFLGLLLLLTPPPSFQSTTNERRNSTGSDVAKPNAVLTLFKPKTTAALPKQTIRPTLKPNTVNQTALPTPATTKSRPGPGVTQTTPSAAVKSTPINGTISNKDKHTATVNQTISTKSPSASDVKSPKDKPTSTGSTNLQASSAKSASTKNTKDKPQPAVSQTISVKSPSHSDGKTAKDKPTSTVSPNLQPASAKSASTKTTKDKLQPAVSQTISVKSLSDSDGKTAKDKPTSTVIQNIQSTSAKMPPASGTKTTKNKPTASVNQTIAKSPSTSNEAKNTKDKPVPTAVHNVPSTLGKDSTGGGSAAENDKGTPSANQIALSKAPTSPKEKPSITQPLQVVISDGCDSSNSKERELKLKPGAPLVMTHKISLLPGGCSGGCESEMTALKERVARLEREMSVFKDKCPCSLKCPNDCSGNGECQKGKCICQQGFMSPDCSRCSQGADCNKKAVKGHVKSAVETVILQGDKYKSNTTEKTKVENTQKKEQKKSSDTKETDTKTKVLTNTSTGHVKTQPKQDVSAKKTTKDSSSATKVSRPTVPQVMLKHEGRKQEETRKDKTALASKKIIQKTELKPVKEGTGSRAHSKSDQLKDEPQANVTLSDVKASNGTSKVVTILSKGVGTNLSKTAKEILEQTTLAEKNLTQSSGHTHIKKVKVGATQGQVDATQVQSISTTEAIKTGKENVAQRSQNLVNASSAATSKTRSVLHKTIIHGSGSIRKLGGSGLGSVKVVNISSYSFTVTWTAPQGMFKNFTVIRREPWSESDQVDQEEFEKEPLEEVQISATKNTTNVQVQTEGTNTTALSGSRGKAETNRISMVVLGNVRSVEFSNLRPNTAYVLQIYGAAAHRKSKIHRVTAVTGPEPVTDMVFSNVTESSLTVSWSKPKTTYAGFRITYTNIVTGEYHFVTVDYQQSHVVVSKLSAGSSYIVSVTTTQGRAQSDALTSIITTVPAPPTHLRVVNVTDTRAVLQWTPSLGKVDRFIVSYESSKTSNVTVTVMLPGNSVEHQLRGLQRGTLYTVKILTQKDSLQSMVISTTFTTANVVKAKEVGARYAVIAWRISTVVYHSYRLIYQVAGEETKEISLDGSTTEYKLTGLLPMSRYFVLVQGEKDGHYRSIVTTEFITGKLRFPYPTGCSQELLNGALESGEVDIYPHGKEGRSVRVYCDMETDGGGWTVFQRRMNGKTDFYRTWSEYTAGFGNLSQEFWLGNELLHNLTSVATMSLRVDMQYGNDTVYAHYANFSIDSKERHFTLSVSGYIGTAGDSMRYHNGRPFSTWDKDPDPLGIHCATAYMGGWWYKNCYKTNLNGLYGSNSDNQGIVWIDWKGKDTSIPFTEMKFRPAKFSPATHG